MPGYAIDIVDEANKVQPANSRAPKPEES